MVVLGALVVVLAVLVIVGVAVDNPEAVRAEAFGQTFDGVSTGELFLVGATTGVAGALGLVLCVSGLSRRRSRRVAVQREVEAARSERESLEEENSRLQAELEHSRTTTDSSSGDGRG